MPDDDPPSPPPEELDQNPAEPDVILGGPDTPGSDSESDDRLREVEPVALKDLDQEWTRYFRYKTAYRDQVEAIDTFLDLLADNGYFLFEGACGTGKTLAAVTGGLHAIRDQGHLTDTRLDGIDREQFPEYEQLFVVTPLKQQLSQFVDEMRGVNRSLPGSEKSVPTTVLRGRADMMPYAYSDKPPFDNESLGQRIDDLRDISRRIIEFGSSVPLDWPEEMDPPPFSRHNYNWDNPTEEAEQHEERYRYDPFRAEAVKRIVADLDEIDSEGRFVADGITTPYPDYVPHTKDVISDETLRRLSETNVGTDAMGKFDPFYIGFFAGEGSLSFGFGEATACVFDRDDLFEAAAGRGICPHEAMAHFAEYSEVVLGNYYHLFDPMSRLLTGEKIGLLNKETIVIVDEAHQIESRARDMLSADLDLYTLDRMLNDVQIARNYAEGNLGDTPTPQVTGHEADQVQELVNTALQTAGSAGVDAEDLKQFEQLLRFTKQKLTEYGAEKLDKRYDSLTWREAVDRWGAEQEEFQLTDPEDPDDIPDQFLEDAKIEEGLSERIFNKGYLVMLGVTFAFDALRKQDIHDRTPQGVETGEFFQRWVNEHDIEYFRQVVLEPSPKDQIPDSYPRWVRAWTPKFQLFNCIPRDELRGAFAELGGGVLMSATIQPEEVFSEAVGIDDVPYPVVDDEESDDDDDDGGTEGTAVPAKPSTNDDIDESVVRPSTFEQYPLRFPRQNRLSVIADLPKYIKKNRGSPTQNPNQMESVRRQYATVLQETAEAPGNVLLAMPNYREAEWIYDYLKDDVDKRFHLDQSSSALETTEMLESFFKKGEAVICTSCRGTITEGVDYEGGRLHHCAAVGIPLLPMYSPRVQAIRTAYDQQMQYGSGFETALTVPAVRKVRQAFGRVIRGSDEAGARLLLDQRYASTGWGGVNEYLSDQEREEFELVRPQDISDELDSFWGSVDIDPHDEAREAEYSNLEYVEPSTERTSDSSVEQVVDASSNDASSSNEQSADTPADSGRVEKIYFGKEANLSGWVSLPYEVAEHEIIPIVNEYAVEEEGPNTIKLNFSKGLSTSDWTDIPADIIYDEIEPIAKRAQQ